MLSAGPGARTVQREAAPASLPTVGSTVWASTLEKGIDCGPTGYKNTKQSPFLPEVYGRVTRSRERRQGYRGCSVAVSTPWPRDPSLLAEIGAGIIPHRAAPHPGLPALSRLSVQAGRRCLRDYQVLSIFVEKESSTNQTGSDSAPNSPSMPQFPQLLQRIIRLAQL